MYCVALDEEGAETESAWSEYMRVERRENIKPRPFISKQEGVYAEAEGAVQLGWKAPTPTVGFWLHGVGELHLRGVR